MKIGNASSLIFMLQNAPKNFEKAVREETKKVAYKVQRTMVLGIRNQSFNLAPNSEYTVKSKGSSKPLVDKGFLIQSILVHENDKGFLVGVHRMAKRPAKNGEEDSLMNIFAILTYGVDTITASGRRLKIPARDVITPSIKENVKEFREACKNALVKTFTK